MGLFNKDGIMELFIKELKGRIKNSADSNCINGMLDYINDIVTNKRANMFETEEQLIRIFDHILNETLDKFIDYDFKEEIKNIEKVYQMLKAEGYDESVLFEMIDTKSLNYVDNIVISMFDDNKAYFRFLISCNKKQLKNANQFIKSVVPFTVDSHTIKAEAVNYINKFNGGDINIFINNRISELMKNIGRYDIDEVDLKLVQEKIDNYNTIVEYYEAAIKRGEEKIKAMEKLPDIVKEKLEVLNKLNSIEYNKMVEKTKTEFIETYRALIAGEKKAITELVNQLSESELSKIKLEGSGVLDQFNEFVKSHKELKKIAEDINLSGDEIRAIKGVVVPSYGSRTNIVSKKPVDLTINRYFDTTIPYKVRINELYSKMDKNLEKGVRYHSCTKNVLSSIIEGDNPYLYGPSGTGKSYMVQRICELLNLKCVEIGRVMDKSDILGFINAEGILTPTNFTECYRNGYVSFFDEIDNGDQDSLVALNPFASNSNEDYTFGADDTVKRHPNFRVIAAGNTNGNGSTSEFNGRGKIDESLIQRLTPIYVPYDEKLDKEILKDYSKWLKFVLNFRRVLDVWANNNDVIQAPGAFTTRDAAYLKKYLDNNSKTITEILDAKFIQTKDKDYLLYINKNLKNLYKNSNDEIYKEFDKMVTEKVKVKKI